MTRALADTNLFLRLLVNDHQHHTRAVELFRKVLQRHLRLIWPAVVFVEVIHVLKSPKLYARDRSEIAALLEPLTAMRGLQMERREVARRALELFASTRLDIAHAWVAARAQLGAIRSICTFDDDFGHIQGIERLNP
jgi:predicted nucleic acid-binding protein